MMVHSDRLKKAKQSQQHVNESKIEDDSRSRISRGARVHAEHCAAAA